jgi:hypothetical protein
VLHLAAWIGEPKIYILDFIVLDLLHDLVKLRHRFSPEKPVRVYVQSIEFLRAGA